MENSVFFTRMISAIPSFWSLMIGVKCRKQMRTDRHHLWMINTGRHMWTSHHSFSRVSSNVWISWWRVQISGTSVHTVINLSSALTDYCVKADRKHLQNYYLSHSLFVVVYLRLYLYVQEHWRNRQNYNKRKRKSIFSIESYNKELWSSIKSTGKHTMSLMNI